MAILRIVLDSIGAVGEQPSILRILTDDTIATVLTAGYLSKYGNWTGIEFSNFQGAFVYTTDGHTNFYQVDVTSTEASLSAADPNGVQVIGAPVTDKNFAVFYGTAGDIQDLSYSPTNESLTKVVMAGAATVVNHIASFDDTEGTVSCAPSVGSPRTIVNFGDMVSGNVAGGLVGRMRATAPTANKGELVLQGANNASNYQIFVINASHNQSETHYIPDCGLLNDSFLTTALLTPDSNSNLLYVDITVGQAALAAGGSVTLRASSGAIQYKIRNIFVNRGGTNFSGGGGDRLLSITDNTTVYSVVPAASLQTLANTAWGSVGVPFPASAAINTSTAAGASLVAKYSGGTTDYTAGSVVISLILERVA